MLELFGPLLCPAYHEAKKKKKFETPVVVVKAEKYNLPKRWVKNENNFASYE